MFDQCTREATALFCMAVHPWAAIPDEVKAHCQPSDTILSHRINSG